MPHRKWGKIPSYLWTLLVFGPSLFALDPAVAEDPADLGQGLSYRRIQSPADVEKTAHSNTPRARATVLDLRYAPAGDDAIAALRAVLAGRVAPDLPIFVLVSPATPPRVAQALSEAPSAILTLGISGSQPSPQVTVKTDAATDRKAYDALGAGTPVQTLISGQVEKERFDEATLVHEFKNGNPDAQGPVPPDPTTEKSAAVDKPAPLVDRVLQRAVHLHRALLALRR